MADIGATLREARMRARIDISEVEAETKIRAKYLRALENEEWDLLPGPTFVKTFLRTYADVLGLDSRLLVEEYKLRHERPSEGELRPIGPRSRVAAAPSPKESLAATSRVSSLCCSSAACTCWDGATRTTAHRRARRRARARRHRPPRPPRLRRPTTTTTTAKKKATTAPAAKVVRLQILPTGPVYVCLEAAGNRRLVNGVILDTTSPKPTYRSSRFRITLGNASVRLKIDGKTRSVPDNAEGIGYEITTGGKRRTLSPAQRPVCG